MIHMKRKILSLITAAAVAMPLMAGCSVLDDITESELSETPATREYDTALSMSVKKSDGKMEITRSEKKNTPMGEKDSWTIFVYMCGSNLESDDGSATDDLQQMLKAKFSDNVRFVVQTGGANEWMNDIVSVDQTERYLVQNGEIEFVNSTDQADMGYEKTLKEFLTWGVSTYPAEKMGVILWNHGCGSINGVCADELFEKDTLSLSEIYNAFACTYSKMTDQFEFVGFDACLMSTVETANILASFSRYMVASQEAEPGNGWDYTAIGNFLADNPEKSGADLGRCIADSFYEECKLTDESDSATMAVTDLQKIDEFLVEFNDFSNGLFKASLDSTQLSLISRQIVNAENFGGNNRAEGYTNMVDIGGIMNGCSQIANPEKALAALDKCVVYKKTGKDHKNASGLSIYYPLEVMGSEELATFSAIAVNPYYLSLVDLIANGYSTKEYDNSVFFAYSDSWRNVDCECLNLSTSYFKYADEKEEGNSELISFSSKPGMDEDNYFSFTLDDQGLLYASDVTAFVYLEYNDKVMLLGENYDIYADWENGSFSDNFDGYWLALPNGQALPTYVVDITEDYIIYTCPVYLNGTRTNLRIRQDDEGAQIEGAWDGISEDSIAAKGIRKLKNGDKIEVIYYLDDDTEEKAEAYEWKEDDGLTYAFLPEDDYYYSFCIEDVYGDYYITDPVVFSIDEKGTISFTDLTEE